MNCSWNEKCYVVWFSVNNSMMELSGLVLVDEYLEIQVSSIFSCWGTTYFAEINLFSSFLILYPTIAMWPYFWVLFLFEASNYWVFLSCPPDRWNSMGGNSRGAELELIFTKKYSMNSSSANDHKQSNDSLTVFALLFSESWMHHSDRMRPMCLIIQRYWAPILKCVLRQTRWNETTWTLTVVWVEGSLLQGG